MTVLEVRKASWCRRCHERWYQWSRWDWSDQPPSEAIAVQPRTGFLHLVYSYGDTYCGQDARTWQRVVDHE